MRDGDKRHKLPQEKTEGLRHPELPTVCPLFCGL